MDVYSPNIDLATLPEDVHSNLLLTLDHFNAYLHLVEHGRTIDYVSVVDAKPPIDSPPLSELLDGIVWKPSTEPRDRVWLREVADVRFESTDLYEPPLVYSSFFGEASLFGSAFEFVEDLLQFASHRILSGSIPDFEAKEKLSVIPEDQWVEDNELQMQMYVCDLSVLLARLGQLPIVSDGVIVKDELVREAKAVAMFRQSGRSWAGDRSVPKSKANRGCDPAKIRQALEYVKKHGPVTKQLTIANHIDVALGTFRSNYVPVLRTQGMHRGRDGWQITSHWPEDESSM